METKAEQNGGLFMMNGSQRRIPAEVFLNPLKNISEEQIKNMFYTENRKYEITKLL